MVSNLGNVIRKARTIKTSHYTRHQDECIAKQLNDNDGYKLVNITINMKQYTLKVHRIVANEFCDGHSDINSEVNHKDGDKSNNNSNNLEWIDRVGNVHHAIENELIVFKSARIIHYNCKNCGSTLHLAILKEFIALKIVQEKVKE